MSPTNARRFITYYRVSTDRQGKSGLGLEAQRKAVLDYLNGGAWELVEEYTEHETGKRGDRPELQKALEACRRQRATLVIAKLDRLARNTAFLLTISDSGVNVLFCDLPHVRCHGPFFSNPNGCRCRLEAGLISERTRAALQVAKQRIATRGQRKHPHVKRLGNPTPRAAAARATAAACAAAVQFAANVLPVIRELQAAGARSANAIATGLNARKVPAASRRPLDPLASR
jgi:DNA invertase Pin-like site-specific DNA recombinase